MREPPSTLSLQNRSRADFDLIQQSQHFQKANPIQGSHGKRDVSFYTPIGDTAGNTAYLSDRFVHTNTAAIPAGEANPNGLADRASYWMVQDSDNGAALVEWVRVERSDGQFRFYPTVAF